MAGPWEQYQSSSAEPSGPWSEYRSLPEVVVTADREPVSEIPAARRSYGLAEVPGAFVTNIPSSAKRFAQEAYTALTHPVQTAKGVLDIGAGAIQSVLPQQVVNWVNQFEANPEAGRQVVEAARAAGGVIADRWGSYENAKRTLAEDPVGAMADLSTILTGAAGVTKLAGKGQRALTGGGVIPAEQALVGGLETAAKYTNPFSAVTVPVQGALAFKERVLPGALTKQKEANAVRDATLAAGTAEGYMTTPGSVTPQGKNILAERMAGKTYLEQLMAVNNQEVTNNLARRAVGGQIHPVEDSLPDRFGLAGRHPLQPGSGLVWGGHGLVKIGRREVNPGPQRHPVAGGRAEPLAGLQGLAGRLLVLPAARHGALALQPGVAGGHQAGGIGKDYVLARLAPCGQGPGCNLNVGDRGGLLGRGRGLSGNQGRVRIGALWLDEEKTRAVVAHLYLRERHTQHYSHGHSRPVGGVVA